MEAEHHRRWIEELRREGYAPGRVLGSGMEGWVLALGDGLVAKVWHRRTTSELEALQTFYAAVARAGPPFASPAIHRVLQVDGQGATVEARLEGKPLRDALDRGRARAVDDATVIALVDVLEALAGIEPSPDLAVLPVLEGESSFDAGPAEFARSLAGLVRRRVDAFQVPLSARLATLDSIAEACVGRLMELAPGGDALVHGDLVPGNILVDDTCAPVAVLDFGFMTTVGDPAFDAAITPSIFDMYGPLASQNEAALEHAVDDRFGHDARTISVYRAAYALTTSNCFSPSGSDGHFEWCMRMLERPRVLEALFG